jgi:hypothetical protein
MSRAAALGAAIAVASLALARDGACSGALASIASQIAGQVGPLKGDALVVCAPVVSDVALAKGDELAAREARLVAGALGGTAHAESATATLDHARAMAGTAGQLVFVAIEIARGQVRATVDVYPVPSNAWDRVRAPVPPPRAHAFAEAPLDAEVRAFLPPVPLERAALHVATHDEGDVLAAACGDVDGDGGAELALVSRARVSVGHVVKGAFVPAHAAAWSALAPRAATPLREPLAGAEVVRDGDRAYLLAGTTDRGGVALDPSLALVGAFRGVPVGEGTCALPLAGVDAFAGEVATCRDATKPRVALSPLAPRFDAFAAVEVIGVDGSARGAAVARTPDGKLLARFGEGTTTLDGAGAQVAVADLDQDGVPEIVASSNQDDDTLRVWSWDGASDPRLRATYPAPAGVRAVCACPPEEGGTPALVAIVGNEVWIVR